MTEKLNGKTLLIWFFVYCQKQRALAFAKKTTAILFCLFQSSFLFRKWRKKKTNKQGLTLFFFLSNSNRYNATLIAFFIEPNCSKPILIAILWLKFYFVFWINKLTNLLFSLCPPQYQGIVLKYAVFPYILGTGDIGKPQK